MPVTSSRPTMKHMARDAGSKTRRVGRFPKGSKSKSVTPPLRRQRHGSGPQDPGGVPRDLKDSSDSGDSTWLQQPDLQFTDDVGLFGSTYYSLPHRIAKHSTAKRTSCISSVLYYLYSTTEKEKRQLKEASLSKELLPGSKLTLATASNAISEDACCTASDLVPSKANSVSQTLSFPLHTHMSIIPLGRGIAISPMEGMMSQILEELRAITLSHEGSSKETEDQFSQPNAHLTLLSAGVVQTEQKVSDLEDGKKQQESVISQVQSQMEELHFKLDDIENRSQHSNLRFIGVQEEIESSSSVTKIVTDLIYRCILPDEATTKEDHSIMQAQRVPSKRTSDSKFPRTILVNIGDYRIKEQSLSQAIRTRIFKSGDHFSFHVFSDMSFAAAQRRQEFVSFIDDFKRFGALAGIEQLAKLKVLHKGKVHIFQAVQDAKNFLAVLKNNDSVLTERSSREQYAYLP
ncbi:hypothetical protein NDU88_006986 [Pleurodeles waltl]|uniref:Uncharacterized protein n=1 Tax=Pleurodeles waltl TaxID=8319 RepID=A0AAV7NTJ9_PLEWA|nr:hypothetical protein NDU88_006986 [Pleurodeles waltl]